MFSKLICGVLSSAFSEVRWPEGKKKLPHPVEQQQIVKLAILTKICTGKLVTTTGKNLQYEVKAR